MLVCVADMLWAPALVERRPASRLAPSRARPAAHVQDAVGLYVESRQPEQWEQRRLAAAYLLKQLNPPLAHRTEWELVRARLDRAAPSASAWEWWQSEAGASPAASGLFAAYQNRLSGLRRAQLQKAALRLKPILEKDDFRGYLEKLPGLGESSGPLWLALSLQPQSQIARDDLIPSAWWWPILMNRSNQQALEAGVRLSLGKTPEMPHRWEGQTCVCWTPGPDGQDDDGRIEASFEPSPEGVGDWVYRFR